MKTWLEKYFNFSINETSWKQEGIAGVTTFLTMAYIIFVNPEVLSHTGMDRGAVLVATCLVAAFSSLLIGFLSRYPVAVAPAMALNVYFTYVVVEQVGLAWQDALGAVLISSILFFLIVATKARIWVVSAIPKSLNIAITVGLGLFIALIAMKNAGIIVSGSTRYMSLGSLDLSTVLFCVGFILIVVLDYYKIPGAMLVGILVTTILGLLCGLAKFSGIFSLPPSLAPTFLKVDFKELDNLRSISVIFSLIFVSLFDCTGTLVGLVQHAKLSGENHTVRRIARGLVADSLGSVLAPLLGSSGPSPYLESAAGIRAGGRTGVTSCVVAVLFLLALFVSPLAQTIPSFATAPALLFVACLMIRSVIEIPWLDITESIPCALTAIMIPYTLSVANGIGMGIISYTVIKALTRNISQLNTTLIVLTLLFIFYFIMQATVVNV